MKDDTTDEAAKWSLEFDRTARREPVLRILDAQGGCAATFKGTSIALPSLPDQQFYFTITDKDGNPIRDQHGRIVTRPLPPMQLENVRPDNQLLSYQEVSNLTGLSTSSLKRAVIQGDLPKPEHTSERGRGFKARDVEAFLAKRNSAEGKAIRRRA